MSWPPPPGWYPDPSGRDRTERWWDGQRWSDDVRSVGTLATHTSSEDDRTSFGDGRSPVEDGRSAGWDGDAARGGHGLSVGGGPEGGGGPEAGGTPPPGERGGRIPLQAVLWALLGIFAGEVVGGLLAGAVSGATGAKLTAAGPELAGEFALWGGMIGSCFFVSRRFGTASLQRDLGFGFRVVDLLWGVGAAVTCLVVVSVVSSAFSGTPLAGSNTGILSGQKGNEVGYIVVALIAAVGAPVFEELYFRGLLRASLASRLGPHAAIVGQAILFGLAHVGETTGLANVSVVISLACVGVVLGYTARLTGRLGAGMIAHSLFNLTAVIAVLAR